MDSESPHILSIKGWKGAVTRLHRFLLFNPERDSRFRQEILTVSQRGVRLCCTLGAVLIVSYMLLAFSDGRTLAWTQGLSPFVSGLDKLILFIIIGCAYASSYTVWGQWNARLIVGVGIVLVGAVETSFDLLNNGNMGFTTPWLSVILIAGLGTMPFRGVHALILGIAMTLVYPFVLNVGPIVFNWPIVQTETSQIIFMAVMVVLGTTVSGALYRNKYRSFSNQENLREAKDRISDQANRLQELDHIKARFFANLSHEFRTPLTLMLGPVDDAIAGHSGELPMRLRSQLEIARRNGYRMKRLIDQLLDLSRLEAGRMELEEGMYDFVRFVRTLVSSFSSLAETREINLSFHSSVSELTMAFDADKMEKMITNLLSNAIKFTPAGGKVHLSIHAPDHETAVVSVKDTGPGLHMDQRERIFDRFYQSEKGANLIQAGTGIGLALVKELAALHQGSIHVESEEGFGSDFILRLPIRVTDDEQGSLDTPNILEDGFIGTEVLEEHHDHEDNDLVPESAPLVLVADDNADVRQYLRSHLEKRYRVREAANGTEAVELLKQELPELVLSDVMMPGMTGHELCRTIKTNENTNHIPVVLITAKASESSRREGLESGADDYLFKPFNATDLMIRVENLIEIRKVLRDRFSGEYVIKPNEISVKSAEAEFLERLQSVVEEHIGDTNFGVDWLASEVGISPRQLQRRLRADIGLSAAGFIRTLRLKRAAQLLNARAGTVSEIAYQVGFLDANYFSRLFKQTFRVSPSEFAAANTKTAEEPG